MNAMTQSNWARATAIAVVGAGTAALAAPPPEPMFELRDLGTLGGTNVQALNVNDDGTAIVGWAEIESGTRHAFMWTEQEGMVDLEALGPSWAEARGVNNVGQVVGTALTLVPGDGNQDVRFERHAFLAYEGTVTDLNVLVPIAPGLDPTDAAPFVRFIEANAISNYGAIVGCGLVEGREEIRGFMLRPLSSQPPAVYECVDLGELPLAEGCIPSDICDSGTVVGMSGSLAFIWDGEMQPLDPGSPHESLANAICELGVAVGWYFEFPPPPAVPAGTMPVPPTACVWWNGFRSDLIFHPDWMAEAHGINSQLLIVGFAESSDRIPDRRAVLWEGSNAIDLNHVTVIPSPVPAAFPWHRLDEALAIDESGRIVGNGSALDRTTRAFMLEPIPDG